jgi:hypothetical protein
MKLARYLSGALAIAAVGTAMIRLPETYSWLLLAGAAVAYALRARKTIQR